ncbi:hypothetical protein M0Q50_06830 [bacterium]|nr:hypothetical protein [bacterium]
MNFYIVYCKTRRKFDKYIKINRIRNKVIVDIRELIEQEDIDVESHRDYFNLTVYTKIVHSLKKSKDIYYIPNFRGNNVIVSEILKLKEILNFDIKFNILIFYDEFINDKELLDEVFNNINNFDSSQIIKDY